MNKNLIRNIVVAVVGLLILGGVWAAVNANRAGMIVSDPAPTDATTSTSEVSTSTDSSSGTSRVKVALLDYTGEMPGKQRGCDRVILVDRAVATTTAPLNAALRELFSIKETEVAGLGNFMPRTAATLSFDKVAIENGVAKVYLKGSLSGLAGVCDDPRAKIQIEETALQFPSVKSVELYLDGSRTELQPNEKGN